MAPALLPMLLRSVFAQRPRNTRKRKSEWKMIQQSIQSNNATGWYAKCECYRYGSGIAFDSGKSV